MAVEPGLDRHAVASPYMDISAGPGTTYFALVTGTGSNAFRILKTVGSGYPFNYDSHYISSSGLTYRDVRLSSGPRRVALAMATNAGWRLWAGDHAAKPKSETIKETGSKYTTPMAIATGPGDSSWVAWVDAATPTAGKLMVAEFIKGKSALQNKTPLVGADIVDPNSVAIAVDAKGQPHVTWQQGLATVGKRQLRWSHRKGKVWQAAKIIVDTTLFQLTHLTVSRTTGHAHITYGTSQNTLHHACRRP